MLERNTERKNKLRNSVSNALGRSCSLWMVIGIVLFVFFVTFGAPFLFSLASGYSFTPGDPAHFDPIAALPEVKKYAGEDVHLIDVYARYVRSDGTLDLNAKYEPYVTYRFYRKLDAPPPDAPPLGAGGGAQWFLPITVRLQTPEMAFLTMHRYELAPTSDPPQADVPEPTCSFAALWSIAIEREAPPEAVAVIQYGSSGYSFSIEDTNIRLRFDHNCGLVR